MVFATAFWLPAASMIVVKKHQGTPSISAVPERPKRPKMPQAVASSSAYTPPNKHGT